MKDTIYIYPMVKQLPSAVNRSDRRRIEQEYNRIVEKLCRVAQEYAHVIQATNQHDDMDLFHHYNEKFQYTCDYLGSKAQFHAIHRGWFFLMHQPERIGVMRDEERGTTNAFKNWTIETIAKPFQF